MIPSNLKIMLAVEPIDMRCSIDGLVAAVTSRLKQDAAVERALFVFANARRDRAKMVWRTAHGWCLLYTKLDAGFRVTLPAVQHGAAVSVVIDVRALSAILDGVKKRAAAKDIVREARTKVQISSPSSTTTR